MESSPRPSSAPKTLQSTVQDVSISLPNALELDTDNVVVWVAIAANLLILVVCTIMSLAFTWRNKQVRAGKGKPIEGKVGFYYTI